jgi:YesN/AraC family two-component response regulator
MRTYLRRNLEDSYEIFEASDGVEGMESIQKNIPDIIVSDLMMPNMNGLELCEKVKSNMVTSHIPLIILTAKVNEETAYEGFSFGADDYITKPFSMKLLKIRIEKLIEKNEKLREHFRLSMLANPQHIPVESSNEKFIQLLVKAIDKHIDNYDLNIELLCQQLNITHQQVYRKIKALTGQTVNEFIRTVRLKRAAQLLSESDLNISEIMYSVGFSNRSYFSKCFAEEFHMTPKEYRQNNKQQSP